MKVIRVIVAGMGNIGSILIQILGKMPFIQEIMLIDRDCYEVKNLTSQRITMDAVGREKVSVQAESLRALNKDLKILPIHKDLQHLPVGMLRSDLIFSCLDSPWARHLLMEWAWRLGMPVIDAGVRTENKLARVTFYDPHPASACLECSWSEDHYNHARSEYPCEQQRTPSTNGSFSLGSLAASVQAIIGEEFLTGKAELGSKNQEILFNAESKEYFKTNLQRNPHCRFDHNIWRIQSIPRRPQDITIGQLFDEAGMNKGRTWLRVENASFFMQGRCPACNHTWEIFQASHRDPHTQLFCPTCRENLISTSIDYRDRIEKGEFKEKQLRKTAAEIGITSDDIITFQSEDDQQEIHVMLSPG
ncbi:MAG: ThiF family adenylyltransferase [Candidatus Omnitrophica bacterium]|nr:ThiF family adenylyltransferase [Candidatus Omnitrophota bacterium]